MAEALVTLPSLNWAGFEETLLLNPKLKSADLETLTALYESRLKMPDHLWLSSSGVSADLKLIALSREAFLVSAAAVNREIEAKSSDCWLLCLPTFHVGGLGILARAHLSKSNIHVLPNWDTHAFLRACEKNKVTLTSLVPLQLRDLVHLKIKAPEALRFIFVGGGALDSTLKSQALSLGYPVFETFGMTECCSQIASETPTRDGMLALNLWSLETSDGGFLKISGAALCSAVLSESALVYPAKNGVFKSQDIVELHPHSSGRTRVVPKGRGIEFSKIKGENVSLLRLQQILESLRIRFSGIKDAAVVFEKGTELDAQIKLIYSLNSEFDDSLELLLEFNRQVLPFERAVHAKRESEIKRSALGKIIYKS